MVKDSHVNRAWRKWRDENTGVAQEGCLTEMREAFLAGYDAGFTASIALAFDSAGKLRRITLQYPDDAEVSND